MYNEHKLEKRLDDIQKEKERAAANVNVLSEADKNLGHLLNDIEKEETKPEGDIHES